MPYEKAPYHTIPRLKILKELIKVSIIGVPAGNIINPYRRFRLPIKSLCGGYMKLLKHLIFGYKVKSWVD
jgi:hypothetical protein